MISLTELQVGARAEIVSFNEDNEFTERLQEMGLTTGTEFTLVRRAPFRGPMELSFGTMRLALRPTDSGTVIVKPI